MDICLDRLMNSIESIVTEELYKSYRMFLVKMFIHVEDYLGKVSSIRSEIEKWTSEKWLFSNSRKIGGYKWICDLLGVNCRTLLAEFIRIKDEGRTKIGYEEFCELVLNVRDKFKRNASSEEFARKYSMDLRVKSCASECGMKPKEWILDKAIRMGWNSGDFAIALDSSPEYVSKYFMKKHDLRIDKGGLRQ